MRSYQVWWILILPATTNNNNQSNLTDSEPQIPTQDVEEQQDVTKFVDVAVVSSTALSPYSEIAHLDADYQVKAFLARPERIYSGSITPSSVSLKKLPILQNGAQTPIASFEFPKDAMSTSKYDKLNYFKFLKCDTKIRIQIAANPFVAGRLLITMSPNDAYLTQRHQVAYKGLRGLSAHPGLELDLQSATAADLLIPWCGEADAADVTNRNDFNACKVDIWLITPLSVATNAPTANVPIQVYASLENVELRLPTPVKATLQVNRKKEAPGPIQEIAGKVGKATDLFKDIPVVGTVASNVSWVSNLISGAASIFGWSRPIVGPTEPVVNVPGRGYNNFKASDASVVLGFDSENSIGELHNIAPEDVDEMSVGYVCARRSLCDVVEWKATDSVDTVLGTLAVGPLLIETSFSADGETYVDATCGDYLMSKFRFWRADTHFRLSVVKTAYHVGRLEVFYFPIEQLPSATDLKALDTTNCYREIFDITDRDEIEFVVPYLHRHLLQQTTGRESPLGFIVLRVVSPLTSPDTVSDSIHIHLWKWYESVAVTGAGGMVLPTWNGTIDGDSRIKARLQVNAEREKSSPCIVFGQTNSDDSLIEACSTVCGEICVNLRAATRGFRLSFTGPVTNFVTAPSDNYPNTYVSMCANLFAYYRGGVSFKFISDNVGAVFSKLDLASNTSAPTGEFAPTHYTHSWITPVHEISVPFYSVRRRLNTNLEIAPFAPKISVYGFGGAPINLQAYVAGKDDLTFSFLVGPAVMVLDQVV